MSKFRPLSDRVLVLPDSAPVKQGGLAQPTSQQDVPTQGVVVAAGRAAIANSGMSMSPCEGFGVAIGERVQWRKHSGHETMHDGVKHWLLRLEEVEGCIEE